MSTRAAMSVVEAHAVGYRRAWMGSISAAFLAPLCFLLVLGVGLGDRVDAGGGLDGDYLLFIAPGLLAAAAVEVAASECTWRVLDGLKYRRTFHAILATPVAIRDLVVGRLAWVGVRMLLACGAFFAVAAAFGAFTSPLALAALPAALLTGLAVAAPLEGYSATLADDAPFSLIFRLLILPMALFSGAFFPIDELPDWVEPVAWLSPLAHGTALCRHLSLGDPTVWDLLHAGVLAAFALGGIVVAFRTYRRRLED